MLASFSHNVTPFTLFAAVSDGAFDKKIITRQIPKHPSDAVRSYAFSKHVITHVHHTQLYILILFADKTIIAHFLHYAVARKTVEEACT